MVVRGARCLARRLLCLADPAAECTRARPTSSCCAKVRTSFLTSDRTYGARRVWHDLLAEGIACGLHRIERLMRPRPCGHVLDGDGCRWTLACARRMPWPPNVLNRPFDASAANRKWVADFTYIWTAEGWLYVAAVIDLFSRRVVGWSMSATMTAQLVTDALVMAIWRRGKPETVLHHSDRGSQYTSEPFQRLLADHGVTCSMSRAGQCLGQCGDGELLLLAENRTHGGQDVPHASAGQGRCVRLHRMLLQSAAAALHAGVSQSHGVRNEGRIA